MLIKAPPQRFLRLKIFVFLAAVCTFSLTGTYMFASYVDTVSKNENYLTLGFHHVYVASQRAHELRRRDMAQIMRFQGIPFGFFPATSAHDIDNPGSYKHWLGEERWMRPMSNHTESSELLAYFRTHMNIISDIVRLRLPSALVLADTVDLELDAKQQMHAITTKLPSTWDVLFLGHCSQLESARLLDPPVERLFVANNPDCSFAYALTQQGARRLKRVLDNVWPRPGKPFDQALGDMVRPLYLEAYVIDPPLVTQSERAIIHRAQH
ncbi:hypothetical protein LPJ59_000598 [Coemansia sp. RSA 2399]|nr:hypothetical protein LPJ59_000598 [Coemansia sp. RSA 2399]KAJ1908362.1 hypothetical protein LPJ81_000153 [Coemansia sp. IMI 209127]